EKPIAGAKIYRIDADSLVSNEVAVSDDQGRFQFAGDTRVTVLADGYGITGGYVTADSSPDDPVEIALHLPAELHVRFLTPDGKPAANVKINLGSAMEKRI